MSTVEAVPLQIDHQEHQDFIVLELSGVLDGDAARPLIKSVESVAKKQKDLVLDLADVASSDSFGLAGLAECLRVAERRHCAIRAKNISSELQAILADIPAPANEDLDSGPQKGSIERVGGQVAQLFEGAGAFVQLLADTTYWTLIEPLRGLRPPPPPMRPRPRPPARAWPQRARQADAGPAKWRPA